MEGFKRQLRVKHQEVHGIKETSGRRWRRGEKFNGKKKPLLKEKDKIN